MLVLVAQCHVDNDFGSCHRLDIKIDLIYEMSNLMKWANYIDPLSTLKESKDNKTQKSFKQGYLRMLLLPFYE